MIAADTSSLVVYLAGGKRGRISLCWMKRSRRSSWSSPAGHYRGDERPRRGEEAGVVLAALPALELDAGFWERAGLLRGRVLATRFKARVADALIAQACIDHDVALITRDKDFRHFVRHALRSVP